jgi:hypothetical protein
VFLFVTFFDMGLVLYFGNDGSLFRLVTPAFIRAIRRVGTTFGFGFGFAGGFLRAVTIAPCYYRLLFSEPIIKR